MTERDGSRLGLLLEASGGAVDPLALGGALRWAPSRRAPSTCKRPSWG